jgi:hypothetical protein
MVWPLFALHGAELLVAFSTELCEYFDPRGTFFSCQAIGAKSCAKCTKSCSSRDMHHG